MLGEFVDPDDAAVPLFGSLGFPSLDDPEESSPRRLAGACSPATRVGRRTAREPRSRDEDWIIEPALNDDAFTDDPEQLWRTCCAARAASTSSSRGCPKIPRQLAESLEGDHVGQAREREPLAVAGGDVADLGESPFAVVDFHRHDHARRREHVRREPFRARFLELSTTVRPSSRNQRARSAASPPSRARGRRSRAIGPSSRCNGSRSSHPFQSNASPPPGPSYAVDLGQRPPPVEPVERLPRDHRVDAPIRQRDRLGSAVERSDPRYGRSSSARIGAPGSTATTSTPSATRPRVSFPVPAPRSSTRPPGSSPSRPAAQRRAASGTPAGAARSPRRRLEAAVARRASDTARGAEVADHAVLTAGAPRDADAPTVPDQQMREASPVGARHELDQVALDLHRILLPREPESL